MVKQILEHRALDTAVCSATLRAMRFLLAAALVLVLAACSGRGPGGSLPPTDAGSASDMHHGAPADGGCIGACDAGGAHDAGGTDLGGTDGATTGDGATGACAMLAMCCDRLT